MRVEKEEAPKETEAITYVHHNKPNLFDKVSHSPILRVLGFGDCLLCAAGDFSARISCEIGGNAFLH